jgi:hypothetical protein
MKGKPTMARKDALAENPTAEEAEILSTAPADWEWDTVSEEAPTQLIMDEGDTFVGQYKGVEHIEPDNGKDEPFDLLIFIGRDSVRYSMAPGYKLEKAMKDVTPDQWVRITFVKTLETGRGLNPMKDYKVEVRK